LVLRELREHPTLFDLPVVMLTGRRGQPDVDLAMFAGADDYIKKPFDPDEFVFRIEEVLHRREKGVKKQGRL
ncbi:MAG: response regulator, partial [Zymomonas sp.]